MNKINYWKTHPEQMNLLVNDLIKILNRLENKVLLHTNYMQSKEELLAYKNHVDLVVDSIILLIGFRGSMPVPSNIKAKIKNSIKDSFIPYVEVTEILRLRLLRPKQVRMYESMGLLPRKIFSWGHGCPLDSIKKLIT